MRKAIQERRAKRKERNEPEGLVKPKRIRRKAGWWIEDECGMEEIAEAGQQAFMLSPGGYPPDDLDFEGAKMKERGSWQRREVFELVKDVGQKC